MEKVNEVYINTNWAGPALEKDPDGM